MTIDAQILSALREASGSGVSGADLSRKLGISRAAIWARIDELRALGYNIEASPHYGYRLIGIPDVLHGDDLQSRLGKGRIVGRDIRVFAKTTSTNDLIGKLAQDGVKEGVVVFAESQTKGRGRLGRHWTSPTGKGLWFSVLLRPSITPQLATQLTIAASTALARAIASQTGITPDIKWPNDLLIRGKKAAGILMEVNGEIDQVKYAILGVGIDVNQDAGEFPAELRKVATSLKIEAGREINRADLAAAVLSEMERDYAQVCSGHFEALAREWRARCVTLGREVSIHMGTRDIFGRAESIDSEGALLVRTQHGHLERIVGGDVILEK